MIEVGLLDFVIFLGYLSLMILIFFIYRSAKDDQELYSFYLKGFGIKVLGGLAFFSIYMYYYGFGDTFQYFRDSRYLSQILIENPGDYFKTMLSGHEGRIPEISHIKDRIHFSKTSEEWFMVRLLSPLNLLSFNSYLVLTLITSTISFAGAWKLFKVFADILNKKTWAFAAAFLVPSVVFWSSGVIKDTITLAALNYMVYVLYFWIFKKQTSFKKVTIMLVCTYVIFMLKSYILLAFVPTIGLFLYFKFASSIQSPVFRYTTLPLLLGAFAFITFLGIEGLSEESDKYKAEGLETQVKGFHSWHTDVGGSNYDLGVEDYEVSTIVSTIPAALNVTYFRPYIWEANNPVLFLGAMESLFLFILFLRAMILNGFRPFRNLKSSGFLKASIAFIIVFGFAVGFTSYNFGALARYKIPVMSFVVIVLMVINRKEILNGIGLQFNKTVAE